MDRPPPPAEQFRSLGLIYQLVSEFLAPIVLGLLVDWLAETAPWATIIGVLIGVLIGGTRIYRIAGRIGNTNPPSPPTPLPQRGEGSKGEK